MFVLGQPTLNTFNSSKTERVFEIEKNSVMELSLFNKLYRSDVTGDIFIDDLYKLNRGNGTLYIIKMTNFGMNR
jgi:hypothetical protein